jgi:hypothetical protein
MEAAPSRSGFVDFGWWPESGIVTAAELFLSGFCEDILRSSKDRFISGGFGFQG